MDKYIDLHVHTTSSDGSLTPKEVVRYAKQKGLAAIAITDHDTVDGIEEALEEGKKLGVEVIPGLEISADFKPEMHILGYFSHDNYLNIKMTLDKLKLGRGERNKKIVKRLCELGMSVTLEELKNAAFGGIVGRPHIAKTLVQKGYAKSTDEAFEKYLCSGGAAYFKRFELKPEEGIKEILEAGGVPSLAHPIYLYLNYNELDSLLKTLVKAGLKGMEARYVDNSEDDTGNLLRLATKHNLIVTGGSDFHGDFKKTIDLGIGRGNLKVPYELLDKLKEALK